MSRKHLILGCAILVGLALAGPASEAGVLWTFTNQHSIEGFGTGGWPAEPLENCVLTWDAAGKLVATGTGGNPIEFGTLLSYPGSSHPTVPFAMHPLLTWRMQVTGGPATDNHGIVIAFTDDGQYLGKSFRYDSGDMVIQQDFTDPDGRFGDADPAASNIMGVRFYMSYDVAAEQEIAFDWIALGDAAMLAYTPPTYLFEFNDASDVDAFVPGSNEVELSWLNGGYMRQTVTEPYTNPLFNLPAATFPGAANPYVFIKMSAIDPPDGAHNKGAILGFFDSPDGTFVAKNFNFHPGANLIVNDPSVQGVNISVPGGGVEVGTPLWREYTVNTVRLDIGDDPDQQTSYENLVVDYEYIAVGGSVVWMLEREYPGSFSAVVPDVTGMTRTAAEAAIAAAGMLVGDVVEEWSDTVPAGYVMSQYPEAGLEMSALTTVDLVVSLGIEGEDPDEPAMPVAGVVTLGLLALAGAGIGLRALRKS